MKTIEAISGYRFPDADQNHSHAYLLPQVTRLISTHFQSCATSADRRIFDVGCGNGFVDAALAEQGYVVAGVDPSTDGIQHANHSFPHLDLRLGSAYEDLAVQFGTFPIVISLEVVEHLYAPRDFAATLFSLVQPGGIAIVSTPYHGYIKNLL